MQLSLTQNLLWTHIKNFKNRYPEELNCFSGGSMVKNSSDNARNIDPIPGLGRSPKEGNGNPLQYSCLKNPVERGTWQATVHGISESDMT